MGGFFSDLGKALSAWRSDLRVPLITAILSGAACLSSSGRGGWHFVVSLVAWLVLLGFFGAQRDWYRATWAGEHWSLGDVGRSTRSFFGPFLGLAVIFTLFSIPLFFLGLIFEELWAQLIMVIILDMIFTFATPALVFTTRNASHAVSIGFRMLKSHWRHGFPYIVFPPLVVQALWAAPDLRIDLTTAVLISVLGGLVGLLFKGATAAFYLRHGPPPEEGVGASEGGPRQEDWPYGGQLGRLQEDQAATRPGRKA